MVITEEAYLEHFGVKGMRWGVRNKRQHRYETYKKIADGTATRKEARYVGLSTNRAAQRTAKRHIQRMDTPTDYRKLAGTAAVAGGAYFVTSRFFGSRTASPLVGVVTGGMAAAVGANWMNRRITRRRKERGSAYER